MARSKSRTGKTSTTNPEATPIAPEVVAAAVPVAAGGQNGKSKSGPKILKSSTKPTMVPFSLEEEIRRRAYELYAQRGYSTGGETNDWLVAEREILERYQEHRA